ncbi:MAG: CRISPR-associated endonuclease Cas2 [Clostridiales bacterium]|nr:CRISPR-associated endonuclease Cas2 [Clostridiales bacterium]
MRMFVIFDLPTNTSTDKRNYSRFRKFLLKDGYQMLQYSVYCRIANGTEGVEKHINRITKSLPPRGNIRFFKITEKQFADMLFLVGNPSKTEEKITAEPQIIL